ncbi:hypothetical protein Poly41_00050 [Novipirellula artificiosorum]|uniref:Uncharacterized protein n=1 Tax=Novipirellula artificiosorum TaxID=2528016 RepID=A0A5C6DWE0_9BACT|nr:hypothetical protein Poly41_00050 [Novipirellula artificiosorum]
MDVTTRVQRGCVTAIADRGMLRRQMRMQFVLAGEAKHHPTAEKRMQQQCCGTKDSTHDQLGFSHSASVSNRIIGTIVKLHKLNFAESRPSARAIFRFSRAF